MYHENKQDRQRLSLRVQLPATLSDSDTWTVEIETLSSKQVRGTQ